MIPNKATPRILIAALFGIVLASCATRPYSARLLSADEHNRCAVQGGRVDRVMKGGEACIIPTTDAGKACSDRSACQGTCEATKRPDGKFAGICSREKGAPSCALQWVDGKTVQSCNL